MQQRAGVERLARTGMLVSQVDLNAFNKAPISWILVSHITLTVVEVPLIPLLNLGIFDFLYKSCQVLLPKHHKFTMPITVIYPQEGDQRFRIQHGAAFEQWLNQTPTPIVLDEQNIEFDRAEVR